MHAICALACRAGAGDGHPGNYGRWNFEGAGPSASDFNAVQRGDAEMENKMNRVIRACVEMGVANPIVSIHDQGAGGNGNVLKELSEPLGARLDVRDLPRVTSRVTSPVGPPVTSRDLP